MKKILFAVLCFALLGWALASCTFAAGKSNVLIVHSYHKESEWVETMSTATVKSLKDSGIEYEFFYMDTFRRNA